MMPKAKGDPYFISCKAGAEKAAQELGVELLWDGPTDLDPAKQNEVVEAWITRGVNAILKSTMAPPTTRMVSVWPSPQRAPTAPARHTDRSRQAIVDTATI